MATSNTEQQIYTTMNDYQDSEDNQEDELAESAMSLVDHLEELRWRIFKVLLMIAAGSVVAFIFRDQLMHFLELPLPIQANALDHSGDGKLVVMGLTEAFTVTLLVSIVAGIILSIPVLLYQTWAFVAPGLYAHEKKHAVPFISIGLVLFLVGISLGYVVLRYPVEWFINFSSTNYVELVTASSYFSFIAIFILVFGLIFELPLVLTFLAKVGLVSIHTLRKKRAVAHIGMWTAACFATPGADLYSPVIIGVAMSCLYELTIIFIHFTIKDNIATA